MSSNFLLSSSSDPQLILSIFSVVATLAIGVFTLLNTIILAKWNKKNQGYREVIAKQRLKDYNDIRECLSEFMIGINTFVDNGDKTQFNMSYCKLICQFKPQYTEDKEILNKIYELHEKIINAEKGNSENLAEINNLSDKIRNMVYAYCAANWQCIKTELGKTKMKHDNTSEIYNNILKKIERESDDSIKKAN